MGNIPTVDRSEIPRPTTWDGEKTLKIMVDFNYQPQLMCSWSPKNPGNSMQFYSTSLEKPDKRPKSAKESVSLASVRPSQPKGHDNSLLG